MRSNQNRSHNNNSSYHNAKQNRKSNNTQNYANSRNASKEDKGKPIAIPKGPDHEAIKVISRMNKRDEAATTVKNTKSANVNSIPRKRNNSRRRQVEEDKGEVIEIPSDDEEEKTPAPQKKRRIIQRDTENDELPLDSNQRRVLNKLRNERKEKQRLAILNDQRRRESKDQRARQQEQDACESARASLRSQDELLTKAYPTAHHNSHLETLARMNSVPYRSSVTDAMNPTMSYIDTLKDGAKARLVEALGATPLYSPGPSKSRQTNLTGVNTKDVPSLAEVYKGLLASSRTASSNIRNEKLPRETITTNAGREVSGLSHTSGRCNTRDVSDSISPFRRGDRRSPEVVIESPIHNTTIVRDQANHSPSRSPSPARLSLNPFRTSSSSLSVPGRKDVSLTVDNIKANSVPRSRKVPVVDTAPRTSSRKISSSNRTPVNITTPSRFIEPSVPTVEANAVDTSVELQGTASSNNSSEQASLPYDEIDDAPLQPVGDDNRLLTYPYTGKKSVTIYERDFERLGQERLLNDSLIDIFPKIWSDDYPTDQIHTFSSFFYTQLTHPEEGIDYEKVKRWTSKENIFEKSLVIVPVAQHNHWYLVVVANPALCIRNYRAYVHADFGEQEACSERAGTSFKAGSRLPKNRAYLFVLDPLRCDKTEACENIRDYLKHEALNKLGIGENDFLEPHFAHLNCPMQQNVFDCGIFCLHFIKGMYTKKDAVMTTFYANRRFDNRWEAQELVTFRLSLKRLLKYKMRYFRSHLKKSIL